MPDARILLLPFAYRVGFIRPRHRNIEYGLVRDMVPVEVPVASPEEAPVVFSLRWPSQDHDLPTLSFEGRLHRLVQGAGCGPVGIDEFEADVALGCRSWRPGGWNRTDGNVPAWGGDQYPRLPILRKGGYGERSPMRLPTLEEFADDVTGGASRFRLVSDDRQERMAESRETLARGLVAVGGAMWSTAYGHEPYWGARAGGVHFCTDPDPSWSVVPFRLDRLAEAEDFAAALGPGDGSGRDLPSVEVPRADLLRLDEAVLLARQALAAARACGRQPHPGAEPDSRLSRVLARDGVDDVWGAAGVLEDLRVVAEGLEGEVGTRDGALLERLGPAIARWHALRAGRPDLDDAVEALREDDLSLSSLTP